MASLGKPGPTAHDPAGNGGVGQLDLERLQARAEGLWSAGYVLDASIFGSVIALLTDDAGLKLFQLTRLKSIRQAHHIYSYMAGENAKTFVFIIRNKLDNIQRIKEMSEVLELVNIETFCVYTEEGGVEHRLKELCGPSGERDIAVVYQNHYQIDGQLPLQDLFILYANPDEAQDFALAKYLVEPGGGRETSSAAILHPENRTKTMFSIVLPARNGARYLKHTLRTILEQNFDDFEVILSDNSSEGQNEIRELVAGIDSDKIKYHRTNRNLDLPDSFEYAYSKASGEYLFAIGADDGLLLHGLGTLASALNEVGPAADVMKYEYMYYGWPDAQPSMFQYFTRIPLRKRGFRISAESSKELLLNYMNHQASYASLPYGYGEAVLSRRVVNTIKKKTGRLFPALAQDLFMGCTVLALTDEFHYLAYPITIWGASANCCSIGTVKGGADYTRWAHTLEYYSESNRPIKGYYDEDSNHCSPYYYHPDVCGFMANDLLFALCSMDLIERKLVPESWINKINWDSYFKGCVNHVYEDSPRFQEILDQLLEKIRKRGLPDLEKWFLETHYQNPVFKGIPVPPVEPFKYGLFENNILYLKGDDFGLETIYDAAVFYKKLLNG